MEPDRLNSPSTSVITLEVLGHQLQFSQNPNSEHLGTTVWDASMVFAKYLEKNCRKGRFCASKLKGKRVIELGAGCGVAGFGMALLGCDVIATDQIDVLPLLKSNMERNTSRVLQMNMDSGSFGSIKVAELDWGNKDHIQAVGPPFDFIIGTDVVYSEHLLEPLLQTIFALSGPKTKIMLGYEIRSTNVHGQMLLKWRENFEMKIVPKSKMHSKYQHPSIHLYIMELKSLVGSSNGMIHGSNQHIDEFKTRTSEQEKDENGESSSGAQEVDGFNGKNFMEDQELTTKLPNGKLSDWEARRYGSMAARLLQDVRIT